MFREGILFIFKAFSFKLYRTLNRRTLYQVVTSQELTFVNADMYGIQCCRSFVYFTTISVYYPFIHSTWIWKLILRSKIWPDTFTNCCRCLSRESPLAKICWWLPFAAGLTSALSVAGVFMQMWPKFEIILLNLVKIRHFVTGIALKELLNAVRKRMREVSPQFVG